jgi:phenylpyruvate tautomerase PptA (4-oxalocrotonate tautomerase family)
MSQSNDVAVPQCSPERAEELTAQLTEALETFMSAGRSVVSVVNEIRAERAWESLGYRTEAAYLEDRLGVSQRQAYREIDKAVVTSALVSAAGLPTLAKEESLALSHKQVAAAKAALPQAEKRVKRLVRDGVEPSEAVTKVVIELTKEPEPAKSREAADLEPLRQVIRELSQMTFNRSHEPTLMTAGQWLVDTARQIRRAGRDETARQQPKGGKR